MQGNGNGIPATTAACVDAETLAAWVDGGLPKADAAAVEMHLAECERCTAMVATFARTIPDAPVAESLWTRWHLRWLVPLATAATVAALWVLVPRPESPQMTTRPCTHDRITSGCCRRCDAARRDDREQGARGPSRDARRSNCESRHLAKSRNRRRPGQSTRRTTRRRETRTAKRLQSAPVNETLAVAPPLAREADRAEAKSADAQTERFSPPIPSANAAPAPVAPARHRPPPSNRPRVRLPQLRHRQRSAPRPRRKRAPSPASGPRSSRSRRPIR